MPLGSNLARPRRLIVSIDLLWEKKSKIFFSETTGHTALIFCMWQWLMVLYINCASHAPGVKFGHAPGVDSLHRLWHNSLIRISTFREFRSQQFHEGHNLFANCRWKHGGDSLFACFFCALKVYYCLNQLFFYGTYSLGYGIKAITFCSRICCFLFTFLCEKLCNSCSVGVKHEYL